MKYLRYYSEFKDIENATYRIEILQEADSAFAPQEIVLAGDPVTIEWGEVSKIDPVMGSGATLKLISMADGQFLDLYTVEVGAIRLDIYRNGALYWSGTIDTELYEEPYSLADRYVTEVTFSDFAVLERISWQERGVMTLADIINTCLVSSQVSYTELVKYISTTIPGENGALELLSNCAVSLENFYDEDGEAWNMRDVLEEVLRPFALRLKQKNGKIIIADFNGFFDAKGVYVEWRGSDSVLSVEPTYNKVVVRYSPYSQAEIFNGAFDAETIIPNPEDGSLLGVTTIKTPLPGSSYNGFDTYISSKYGATTSVQGVNVHADASLFRIAPDNNGNEAAGIAWGARGPLSTWVGNAPITQTWADPYSGGILMSTSRIPLQRGASNYEIRLRLDLLCDPRSNPFENAEDGNNEAEWKDFEDAVSFCMVPCFVKLYGVDGKIYSYTNKDLFKDSYESNFWEIYKENKGYWTDITTVNNPLWLSYYDEGDRKKKTGLGGWQTNKHSIGGYVGKSIPKDITLNIAGEKIPMPPVAGELQVFVYSGLWLSPSVLGYDVDPNVVSSLRWVLYKDLKVDVVSHSGREIDVEDVEISAWINKAAENELPVDTYIGTAMSKLPLARGVTLRNTDFAPITAISRADFSGSIERLLIGSIYSQYARRKNTIAGIVKLVPEESVLLNKSEVSSRYIILSETEYLGDARADIKMAEFEKDSYEGIEYE